MDIKGKVFIVTGGASGLGEGTARRLAALHYRPTRNHPCPTSAAILSASNSTPRPN